MKGFNSKHFLIAAFVLCVPLGWNRPDAPLAGSSAENPDAARLLRTWVLADFDGDHLPERATGRLEGWGYRVEIQLSRTPERFSFVLTTGALGVRIFASDVDRDDDRDLVIAEGDSPARQSVWLNDGRGHFRRDERGSYMHLPETDLSSRCAPQPDRGGAPALLAPERFPVCSLACAPPHLELGPGRLLAHGSSPAPLSPPALTAEARAPPRT